METNNPAKRTHLLIAAGLAILTLVLLLATNADTGVTWDEPAYIGAAESYMNWYERIFTQPGKMLSQEGIDKYWSANHEHPPLDKIWSGLVWALTRHITDDLTAHRLGNILLAAGLVAMLYLLIAEYYGWKAGLIAAGLLMSLPRFFFHAHLASLDVPAAVMTFAVIFVFWKTKDRPGLGSTIALGVVWGLAVATKINAVFVMPALLLWVLIFQREKDLILNLVYASVTAFGVFILIWPWLFPALVFRVADYVLWITVNHWQIGQFYLHEFYMPPPWHFSFVMFAAVTPLAILLLMITGVVRTSKEKTNQPLGFLLLINALVPLLALAIGQSMVYDNERLFMPAFVFTAALAAIGLDWLLGKLKDWLAQKGHPALAKPLAAAIVLLAFVPQMVSAATLYPHLLSYYSMTVGGLPGATRIGLETTYWCETYNESLDYINEHAEPGDVVWVDPYSYDVMVYYMELGWLRDDIQITAPTGSASTINLVAPLTDVPYQRADFIVLHYRQTSTEYGGASWPILTWLGARVPVVQITHQGIPLFELYHLTYN
ncbi:MAG: glycosyltransferase family 39 protein [Anaerolineales bacterium]